MELTVVVEGRTDLPIVRRLANDAGFTELREHVSEGKPKLDAHLPKYLQAASWRPYFILRDLDQDAACAPAWLTGRSMTRWCSLRLAVREAESWLLADRQGIATFLGVSTERVPRDPDELDRPKKTLVELAARSSKRLIREGMCPRPGHVTPVGPGYAALLAEFVTSHWRPALAERASPSLRSARASVAALARRWRATQGRDV